ncbi:hypothetical protein R5R35_002128 [Gryllus longicercus]|uniref:phosphatidate phosphatase n=1 Tax=Gryllus longicercus TaxID=2509291 RepID=A0AAN9VPR5_9ORTH
MYSMNAIGKFISNFRDFYNEINAATLTGAIDVIVVEQPDGSYTCSPFHVRFGKLGVLRSREKVVDIEINGEQLDIHMKLGDSGEAFFVEEVDADELGEDGFIPPHLACSPIPEDDPGSFAIECAKLEEVLVTDNLRTEARSIEPDYGSLSEVRVASLDDSLRETDEQVVPNQDNLAVNNGHQSKETAVGSGDSPAHQSLPKTFCAETVDDDAKLNDKVRKISIVNGEFRPISLDTDGTNSEVAQQTDDNGTVEANDEEELLRKDSFKDNTSVEGLLKRNSSSAKRKKRRKSLMKRKAGAKKGNGGSSSQTEQSEFSEGSKDAQKDVTSSENAEESDAVLIPNDKEQRSSELLQSSVVTVTTMEVSTVVNKHITSSAENLVELSRIQHASTETDFHFFSDTEVTPGCTPPASRPCSPVQSDTEFEMNRQSKAVGTEDEDDTKVIHGQMQQSWRWGELPSPPPRSIISTQTNRSTSMKETAEQEPISSSDEEMNKKKTEAAVAAAAAAEAAAQRSMLSGMFSFMKKTKRIRHNPESEGIYLSDLNAEELDPEVAALYFPTSYRQGHSSVMQHGTETSGRSRDEDDAESGNGTSLPQSPHSVEGAIGGPKSVDSDFEEPKHTIFEMKSYGEISLSLCGGLGESCGPSEDHFLQSLVTYNDFIQDPKIIENPNLVVRLNGKYYNWRTACPIVMSLVVFQKPLPQQVVDTLYNEYMPLKKGQKKDVKQSSYSSWFYWRRTSEPKKVAGQDDLSSPECEKILEIKETPETTPEEKMPTPILETKPPLRSLGSIEVEIERAKEFDKQSDELKTDEIIETEIGTQTSFPRTSLGDEQKDSKEEGYSGSNSSEDSDTGHPKTQGIKLPMERRSYYEHTDKYRKTLRLSSDQISRLKLHEGGNEVVFSVTTAYQGTTRCKCHIYKWRFDDKIVISDIDGTITKSDVLGHILPIVGKDWAQSGVAQLFTKIKNNGYKLLYLSARAIGQARVTREYLKSIKQGDLSLPDGPLLLNPTSLLSAFHREVIEKKPEEFKISCLRDIQALFPEDSKPFYAGYGNRINDVWAYRAVGIPIFRIFTINHRGELKHELTQTFQSSYSNMSYIVDQMFPPPPEDASEDFTNFIYWRDPIPEIDVDVTLEADIQSATAGAQVSTSVVTSA